MLSVIYPECHLCIVLIMLCHKYALHAECSYAERRYAESRCAAATFSMMTLSIFQKRLRYFTQKKGFNRLTPDGGENSFFVKLCLSLI